MKFFIVAIVATIAFGFTCAAPTSEEIFEFDFFAPEDEGFPLPGKAPEQLDFLGIPEFSVHHHHESANISTLNATLERAVCAINAINTVFTNETEQLQQLWRTVRQRLALAVDRLTECKRNATSVESCRTELNEVGKPFRELFEHLRTENLEDVLVHIKVKIRSKCYLNETGAANFLNIRHFSTFDNSVTLDKIIKQAECVVKVISHFLLGGNEQLQEIWWATLPSIYNDFNVLQECNKNDGNFERCSLELTNFLQQLQKFVELLKKEDLEDVLKEIENAVRFECYEIEEGGEIPEFEEIDEVAAILNIRSPIVVVVEETNPLDKIIKRVVCIVNVINSVLREQTEQLQEVWKKARQQVELAFNKLRECRKNGGDFKSCRKEVNEVGKPIHELLAHLKSENLKDVLQKIRTEVKSKCYANEE